MNAWSLAQVESLKTASNWGKPWLVSEVELIESTMHERAQDVAYVLERSVFAVSTMRGLVREGYNVNALAAGKRRNSNRDDVVHVCTTCWLTSCDC